MEVGVVTGVQQVENLGQRRAIANWSRHGGLGPMRLNEVTSFGAWLQRQRRDQFRTCRHVSVLYPREGKVQSGLCTGRLPNQNSSAAHAGDLGGARSHYSPAPRVGWKPNRCHG